MMTSKPKVNVVAANTARPAVHRPHRLPMRRASMLMPAISQATKTHPSRGSPLVKVPAVRDAHHMPTTSPPPKATNAQAVACFNRA